jgi:hypothetical protein
MRQPIIGSSPNWPRKSRDAPCVWFDRAGRNQLVVTRCGPLRSRFRSDPVGMSRCPHAAAPPSSVMNSRRRMCGLKSRDRTYHIVDAKNALCVEPINVRYARWSGLSVDGGPLPSLTHNRHRRPPNICAKESLTWIKCVQPFLTSKCWSDEWSTKAMAINAHVAELEGDIISWRGRLPTR